LLAAVGAALLASFRCLNRLAIKRGGAGSGNMAGLGAHSGTEGLHEFLPRTVPVPPLEVVVHGPPGWEVVGQRTPGTAFADVVAQGIDKLPQVGLAGSAAPTGARQQRFEQ